MDREVAEKIGELRHLMEHATDADRHKANELTQWFDAYFARATPAQESAVRAAVRKILWPLATTIFMNEVDSKDPEKAAGARLAIEKMSSFNDEGRN